MLDVFALFKLQFNFTKIRPIFIDCNQRINRKEHTCTILSLNTFAPPKDGSNQHHIPQLPTPPPHRLSTYTINIPRSSNLYAVHLRQTLFFPTPNFKQFFFIYLIGVLRFTPESFTYTYSMKVGEIGQCPEDTYVHAQDVATLTHGMSWT